ncbi:LacI family transcriptional regulator [Halanaerobium saccharolyticum]|uniref:LacI family transcriptional regulator n=1 Tax=Halanaerobium saccharolyticum TaxID=43595 RepID=A0A4R6LZE9_9FIRM|nr:LacI family DNA-binding transcriptional regulator [Halanaerobium saccharolyticum]TDO94203.1 LacI family transcriptional regulator [Halanaerobium saccharolyticum]
MNEDKYTVKDIAKMSGFSVRTVSRVINDKPNVKDETRAKIKKILKETGFQSNIFAKNLRKRDMKNIMIVIEKQKKIYPGQWYTNILQKMINTASSKGYNVFMKEYVPEKAKEESEAFKLLRSGFVDAAVVFNIREKDEKVKMLKKLNLPFVTIGKSVEFDEVPYVVSNNWQGAYQAADYLITQGNKELVFMVGSKKYTINKDRISGFKGALKDNNVNFRTNMIYEDIRSFKDSYNLAKKLIAENRVPEAFFISGDEKSFGVLKALNEKGFKVPDEVSVIGFDNIPISEYAIPALTTIEQQADKIVQETVNILMNILNNNDQEFEMQKVIPTKLIIRDSTGR